MSASVSKVEGQWKFEILRKFTQQVTCAVYHGRRFQVCPCLPTYLQPHTEGVRALLCLFVFPICLFASLNLFLSTALLPFLLPRSRVWFFEDVTGTDLPQLRLGAERRDSAVLVPVKQLRIQLQLQPHSMTQREPLLARQTACPGPACGAIVPSASWKTNCSRS